MRLALAAQAPTHASAASHNNHWGVPLSLARAPRDTVYGIYELGMNAPGEIATLARLVRPHVAMITTVEAAHLGFFSSVEAIAEAKGEIFQGLEPGGVAVLNADNAHYARLQNPRRGGGLRARDRVRRGAARRGASQRCATGPSGSDVVMTLEGREIAFRIGAPGRHWVSNALGVIACAAALGADPEAAARALADFSAPAGRGRQHRLARAGRRDHVDRRQLQRQPGLGARGVGRARERARAASSPRSATCSSSATTRRGCTRNWPSPIAAAGIDRVYTAGPAMRHLHDALPSARRGAHVDDAAALLPVIEAELRPGDTLLVKGSLGMRMGRIVEALLTRAEPARRVAGRRR